MTFRDDFLWGAATAAYQIEGAARVEGRGDSVWDMVCRRPGFVERGETGDDACDHYHRWAEDIAIMKEMGLRSYRFSISWPRVLPGGVGAINEPGLAFYDRLVDALREADIEPLVTLFHWDFPTALFDRGGWLNPESPEWFADYTRLVVDRLSDRVSWWLTLNEPQCFIGLGHLTGVHAPGLQLPLDRVLLAGHHALLAHGRAVQTIREHARTPATIGYAPVGHVCYPDTESAADIEAARMRTFEPDNTDPNSNWRMFNWSWWADPVLEGRYPESYLEHYGDAAPPRTDAEMRIISEPVDVLGFNLYQGARVRAGADGRPEAVAHAVGHARTSMGWPIAPDALYWALRFYSERHSTPMLITENGRANPDVVSDDGRVRDVIRIDYLAKYLRCMRRAVEEGIDLRGYCCWSLMDNFEWAHGYAQRFGLVYVDYETKNRTIKDSGRWYTRVVETNGASLDEPIDAPLAAV
ncbi:MAG: GH1 family beta-glucosidase [Planctomycetota bacterium]